MLLGCLELPPYGLGRKVSEELPCASRCRKMKVCGVAFHQPFPLGGTNQTLRAEGRRKDKCKETLSRGSRGYFVPAFLRRQLKPGDTEDWQRSIPRDGDLRSHPQLMQLGGGLCRPCSSPASCAKPSSNPCPTSLSAFLRLALASPHSVCPLPGEPGSFPACPKGSCQALSLSQSCSRTTWSR